MVFDTFAHKSQFVYIQHIRDKLYWLD